MEELYLSASEPEMVYAPGVARKVLKVYIGDKNSIARLCYTAGIKWIKYTCSEETAYSERIVATGSGTTSYTNSQTYNVFSDLRLTNGILSHVGSTMLPGDSLSGYYDNYCLLSYSSNDGTNTTYSYTEYGTESYEDGTYWKPGDKIDNVYAEEGAYPDADIGYTYVDTFTYNNVTYTRMKDAKGDYYAYLMMEG